MAAKLKAGEIWAPNLYRDEVAKHLGRGGFAHLQVRRYGDKLIIESGSAPNRIQHARLRRLTRHLWTLDMSVHPKEWEPTLVREPLQNVLKLLTERAPWVLAPRD